jgi:glutamate/tyrosine decarboxylase-like PLP-dependent enzyme
MDADELLGRAAALGRAHVAGLPGRPAGARDGAVELRAALGGPLGQDGIPAERVLEDLAAGADGGLVAAPGPRYFGFVTGGALPAALAADWLVGAWDQMAGLYASSPAAAVIEEVAGGWLLDLLGLPAQASVGFTTGAQTANLVGLAAARGALLARAGWDVGADGLTGAPPLPVVVGEHAHVTIFRALRLLGLGAGRAVRVAADDQGRMLPDALEEALAHLPGPALVCAQAGEVNTGAFDPLDAVADAVQRHGGWLHVDGAFGLWAAAAPSRADLVAGAERADSWTTDAHKWLNVPYDCGVAVVADRAAHETAMAVSAAYLETAPDAAHDPSAHVPEASRRARGVPVYAALRSLGRRGVADLVERCCALAEEMAEALAASGEFAILNDVVLNQVLAVPTGPAAADVPGLAARIQADGTCWLGFTSFRGAVALRVSVSHWSTTSEDIARSACAIVAAARSAGAR